MATGAAVPKLYQDWCQCLCAICSGLTPAKLRAEGSLPDAKEVWWSWLQLSCGCQQERLQVTVGQQNKLFANSFETRINNLVTSCAPQIPAGLHYKAVAGYLYDLLLALFSLKNVVSGYCCTWAIKLSVYKIIKNDLNY